MPQLARKGGKDGGMVHLGRARGLSRGARSSTLLLLYFGTKLGRKRSQKLGVGLNSCISATTAPRPGSARTSTRTSCATRWRAACAARAARGGTPAGGTCLRGIALTTLLPAQLWHLRGHHLSSQLGRQSFQKGGVDTAGERIAAAHSSRRWGGLSSGADLSRGGCRGRCHRFER